MEYYVFISNDCNLNCGYCSVLLKNEKNKIPKEPMYTIEELSSFIDTMQRSYNDQIADIIFFGGEPTLNFPLMQKLIEFQKEFKELPYEYRYMLHTNGLLLKELPTAILCNLNSIMLSINYDKVPHNGLDNGYFKAIVDSIHSVKQRHPIPIIARLTITEETSLYSAIALFNPFFDAIYWQIENKYSFKSYQVFYNSYNYELNLIFSMWLEYLKRGTLLRFVPIIAAAHFYTSADKHDENTFCCGYNTSMIYIQTNGQCYTCAEDMTTNKNLVGNISDTVHFDNFNLKDTICKSCVYRKMCRGRCGRMHKEFRDEHVQEYCQLNKVLFDLVIQHIDDIRQYCKQNGISLSLDNHIYHYTEYTS